ncbi:MAG: branched-chain amino acid transport system ATP-binding protein [Candidatus Magnetoglobus multicellularis str. Araruama]|uniref:Branched-chain amino acid transport system ATP-binding protein n=1 Tax=Candidatus Magnetoglobus multicellularis str. Araruama TaxID=890399 RepID=A0A1V1PEY2_9BACT|nr:MAG: branched-chain amino acid transport system ATP-binding protein [Candidatus Magnetoglobus multicellularis str. Araruama]
MPDILEVSRLTMVFGGLRALENISLCVGPQKTVALIGPNGAGKTTFFNCITGIYKPTHGDIFFYSDDGKKNRINGRKPNKITQLGMARTFQNIRLFNNMTALENLMIGQYCRTHAGVLGAILRDRATIEEEQHVIETGFQLLDEVNLSHRANMLARNLPYGEQRRLEIARALATRPRLLLLDEPAAGMNPNETLALVSLIKNIKQKYQISILIIEHDMKLVMEISDDIFVLDYGQLIASGPPSVIKDDPKVIQAYLGG